MKRDEVRLECLKLANVRAAQGHDQVMSTAKAFEAYVSEPESQGETSLKKKVHEKKTGNALTS